MSARIAPLEPPYPPEVEADLTAVMPPGIPPIAIFRTWARNPRILRKARLGSLLDRGSLERRDRELVILRACARADGEYEWGVHAAFFAARVGITPEDIAATCTEPGDSPLWSDRDSLLIRMVDELHERADIGDALWAELASHFSDEQRIELVMLAGQYRMIAGFVNAMRLPLEPGAPRFPAVPR